MYKIQAIRYEGEGGGWLVRGRIEAGWDQHDHDRAKLPLAQDGYRKLYGLKEVRVQDGDWKLCRSRLGLETGRRGEERLEGIVREGDEGCEESTGWRLESRLKGRGGCKGQNDKYRDIRLQMTLIKSNGDKIKGKFKEGDSILDVVVNNSIDLDGYGACEGTLTCSTCHVILKQEDYDKLPEKPTDEELDMLDLAYDLTETRIADNEDGDENDVKMEVEDEHNIKQVQENIASIKEKKSRKKQTVLSFEEELNEADDGEIFQVKKSTQSKKLMKILDRERKKKKEIKIEDEKMDVVETEKRIIDEASDLVLVVKNTEMSANTILNGREAEMADYSSAEEDEMKHKFTPQDHVKLLLESGLIPDAATIHAARKRRQLAREMGGNFIPVETSKKSDKSRLVREDDHDGSDEEERVNMEVNMDARTREERREAFMAAQNKAAGEDSDKGEEDDWESQQIRKGVTGAQYMGIPAMPPMILMPQPEPLHMIHEVPTLSMHCFGADDSKLSTPQSIVNKLKERLVSLKEVHHRHTQDRDRVADDLVTLSAEREDLESEGPALVQRFRFYQELRGYVTDLVECLDEKVAVIHALEQRMLALLKKRSDDLMERRRQDVRDQSEELSPLSSQYLYNRFNRSGSTPSQRRNREEEESRIRRAAEREGRRTRRRRAREGKYTPTRHVEGMSSDDEMTELEAVAFRTQKDLIESDARLVFEDVVEEFCSVRSIVKRFESWRFTDSDAYKEAYVSLCLPKVLGPIIRLKLITWSPLQESVEFERHKWYDTLLLYGLKESENEELLRQDPDLRLVPTIVEKVILPKLTQLVEAQWDPLSTSQSLRLVGLTNRLIQEYPTMLPSSKYLEKFLNSVIAKMKSCVENDVFIPIYPKL
uniref:Uncharacterized protein n=1 Tax=Timema monikensis TaxID=170555 RepID=A0A7R9HID3_9NEOP|nr:unnamed protein product [Timema monikensis]